MLTRLRPSPALCVALLALFVSLAGTAVAAGVVPLAKRALVAENAKKLGGRTPAQVAATPGPATSLDGKSADEIAATPGPASTAAGVVSTKTAAWTLAAGDGKDFSVACDAGQKAIAGGFDNPTGFALPLDTRPSSDGGSWKIFLGNVSNSAPASGTLYAVCLK